MAAYAFGLTDLNILDLRARILYEFRFFYIKIIQHIACLLTYRACAFCNVSAVFLAIF